MGSLMEVMDVIDVISMPGGMKGNSKESESTRDKEEINQRIKERREFRS